MPRPTLLPCPFCGNPRPALRACTQGPVITRRHHGRRVRDTGSPHGFEVYCGACHAVLFRPWLPPATRVSVQRAVADLWNARAPQCPSTPGGPAPCPLCGWPRPIDCAVWIDYAGKRYLADALRCAECGLCLTPGWRDYAEEGARSPADLAEAWSTRQGEADWRLLQACAPVEPLRCVVDEAYLFGDSEAWKRGG